MRQRLTMLEAWISFYAQQGKTEAADRLGALLWEKRGDVTTAGDLARKQGRKVAA